MIDWEPLIEAAREARDQAHAPFSRFAVGAALLTADGTVFRGCNVENRSFGLTICAERTAVASAVAAGRRDLAAIVVVTDTSPPAAPCGMCRETLQEFAPEIPILLVGENGERRLWSLAELFPEPFDFPSPL